MNYEDFKEQFTDDVMDRLFEQGIEVKIEMREVNKLNESYEAVTVTPEGSNVGVNVNIDNFYEAMNNGKSYDEVLDKAVDIITKGINERPSFDIDALTDYSQMKDKLVMEVVSAETNKEMLANVPHQDMEDMAVVYRFVVNSDDEGRATILVTNQILDSMGVTPEQLHNDAMENAPNLKPVEIKGMTEVMAEMMGVSVEELAGMGMPADPANEQMYVATVPDKIHGAGVLAYQNFMDQAAERAGGECLGLRWQDLDFENRTISIDHNFVHRRVDEDGSTLHINTPKTEAGKRTIPMIEQVYEAFLEEYQIQQITGFCTQDVEGYSGFVFVSSNGTVTLPAEVNRAIHRIVDDYNAEETALARKERREPVLLPQFSAHHLRHTFCTRLCENESNLKVIQSVMGHKDIQTTMDIYADCTEDKKQEVIKNIEGKIFVI